MGVDGGEYSLCRKRGVGFGDHVCRAGFLCETALGDFRVGDAIENGTRQGRAPLRAVAGTRAPAERPVSLDGRSPTLSAVHPPTAVRENTNRCSKTLTTQCTADSGRTKRRLRQPQNFTSEI